MQYKRSRKGAMEIGRELGVDYLLEGSVRRDAGRVRITAQLVDVGSQTQLWAETYERSERDVLMLQRDVAVRIAQSLAGGVFSPVLARATKRSPSFAAYERVLRGRALRQVATEPAIREAITMFEHAIALDAEYAAAHAGLADCYRVLGGPGWEAAPPAELLERARDAADKALELDPELPEGYAARAMVRFSLEWDLPAADRDLLRAISLNPSYARAHQYRSAVLTAMSRFDDAVESARKSYALDPLSVTDGTTLGIRLYYAGRYEDAVSQFRLTLQDHPGFSITHWGLGQTYAQMGRLTDAVSAFRTAAEHAGGSPYMRAWLANVLARAGQRDEAERIRSEIKVLADQGYVSPFVFALMAAGFGEREAALEWLERLRAARSGWIPFLPVEPEFSAYRDDPRFRALQTDVKLGTSSLRPHLLPVRQALLGTLHLLFGGAGFLFDEVVLDAAHRLGGREDGFPRRGAFAEVHGIPSTIARPVLAVHALDAARVRLDPGDRVRTGLHARADVELQHDVFRRARREDVHRPLAVERLPLHRVIMKARDHAERPEPVGRGVEAVGERTEVVGGLGRSRTRDDDGLAANGLVELDGFRQLVADDRVVAVMRRGALDVQLVEQLPDVCRVLRRPLQVGRVELDLRVAHRRDAADGAHQVLHQEPADAVELDAHLGLRRGERRARGQRQRARQREECAA
jgi:tetratricopeptide (TPR) repeat protein